MNVNLFAHLTAGGCEDTCSDVQLYTALDDPRRNLSLPSLERVNTSTAEHWPGIDRRILDVAIYILRLELECNS